MTRALMLKCRTLNYGDTSKNQTYDTHQYLAISSLS